MRGYGPNTYGDHFADVYDDWYADVSDVEATVAGLLELGGGEPILELGVGTGRLAIPLAEAGAEVVGIDASQAMLDRLAAKDGSDGVATVLTDMEDPIVEEGRFGLAFATFNTFFNLTDHGAQQRCAIGVHRALRPRGAFVIEGFVPPAEGLHAHGLSVRELGSSGLVVTAAVHDASTQQIRGQHVELSSEGARLRPWVLHYLTPQQLDGLLGPVGFTLEARWGDWSGSALTADAESHVSVYRRRGRT